MSEAGPSNASKWGNSLNGSARRIQKELREITSQPPIYCTAGPKGDNIYEWIATIEGPPGSPYETGIFFLSIDFPKGYPFSPPEITFRTLIYHCNVNSAEPNPHNPLVGSIAVQYLTDREKHDETAHDWTLRFAS